MSQHSPTDPNNKSMSLNFQFVFSFGLGLLFLLLIIAFHVNKTGQDKREAQRESDRQSAVERERLMTPASAETIQAFVDKHQCIQKELEFAQYYLSKILENQEKGIKDDRKPIDNGWIESIEYLCERRAEIMKEERLSEIQHLVIKSNASDD